MDYTLYAERKADNGKPAQSKSEFVDQSAHHRALGTNMRGRSRQYVLQEDFHHIQKKKKTQHDIGNL